MGNTMRHWNGYPMCAIDVETTGLDPMVHELIQLAIIPLDSDCRPRTDVLPLNIEIIPERKDVIDQDAMSVNRARLSEIALRGFDREKAKDILELWYKKLDIPTTKWGNPKQIIPLGHNYAFDRSFIAAWLGQQQYDEMFNNCYRDTMHTAAYLNDRAAMHAEVVPYSKLNLRWLASTLKIEYHRTHDALEDARVCAEAYRLMLKSGLL